MVKEDSYIYISNKQLFCAEEDAYNSNAMTLYRGMVQQPQ